MAGRRISADRRAPDFPSSYPGPSTPQDIPRLAVPELERANPPQPFLGEPVCRMVGRDIFVFGELKSHRSLKF
jgi:hypothetical protein